MKPLIKWPGGKSNEISEIKEMIPNSFDRYIEPFMGGGAVFFHIEPKKALVNDICDELVLFYKFIKDEKHRKKFKEELYKYVENWEKIKEYMEVFEDSFITLYEDYRKDEMKEGDFIEKINKLFLKKIFTFNGLFFEEFCIDREALLKRTKKTLVAKLRRTKKKVDVKNNFSNEDIKKNIETAFRSGFYTHFREIMNKSKKGKIDIPEERRIANYYFIREFCYGGMFRFNKNGEFNVPYGGIAYNKKDFRKKVDYIFSDKVRKIFKNTEIKNVDFEDFLGKYKPRKEDFMFLDPPYDTTFSKYEENAFTKKDQKRLANIVFNTDAKFILIIKETPFILDLYGNNKSIKIDKFGKKYQYNVKGRNKRKVKHLIIHNLKNVQQLKMNVF